MHFDANSEKFADKSLDTTRFIDFDAQFIFDDLMIIFDSYTFDGWYYSETKIVSDDIWNYIDDVALTASWTASAKQVTILFEP